MARRARGASRVGCGHRPLRARRRAGRRRSPAGRRARRAARRRGRPRGRGLARAPRRGRSGGRPRGPAAAGGRSWGGVRRAFAAAVHGVEQLSARRCRLAALTPRICSSCLVEEGLRLASSTSGASPRMLCTGRSALRPCARARRRARARRLRGGAEAANPRQAREDRVEVALVAGVLERSRTPRAPTPGARARVRRRSSSAASSSRWTTSSRA